ncbi:MAG: hypothetical protein CMB48_06820 [Euryarchaeota archaeon]|nr:hypothetical protein [Euryarchaeota archaeon]
MTAIYIHIPFCRVHCPYSDYNTYVGMDSVIPNYISALQNEASYYSIKEQDEITSIYIGGGTPSILSPDQLLSIFTSIEKNFNVSHVTEITIEVNPGILNGDLLKSMHQLGINRISIGAQSTNNLELQALNCSYTKSMINKSVIDVMSSGINNINIDLLYGIPHQSNKSWKKTIKDILLLDPTHISLNCLELSKTSQMHSYLSKHNLTLPSDDANAAHYKSASEQLNRSNFKQYAITLWHKDNKLTMSRHNLTYLKNTYHIGLGAGANSWYKSHRYYNINSPYSYIKSLESKIKYSSRQKNGTPASSNVIYVNKSTEMNETMIMGLRLVPSGIDIQEFQQRFNISPIAHYEKTLEKLDKQNLINITKTNITLTNHGELLSNRVFSEFI